MSKTKNISIKDKEYLDFLNDYYCLLKEIDKLMQNNKYKNLSLEKLEEYNQKLFKPISENNKFLLNKQDELHQYMSLFAYHIVTTFRYEIFRQMRSVIIMYEEFYNKTINILKDCFYGYKTIEDFKNIIKEFHINNMEYNISQATLGLFFNPFLDDIVMNSNLNSYDYLYYYGKYISNNEYKIVDYFNKVDETRIKEIAKNTIDGFKRGFENQNLDLKEKGYVILYYPLGFEKVAREIKNLLSDELSVIFKISNSSYCNRQLNYFHKNDNYIILDDNYVKKYLKKYEEMAQSMEFILGQYAGPLWIETFGETQFEPKNEFLFDIDKTKQELEKNLNNKYSLLFNKYTHKEERSFTIISYPCPDIGDNFEEIFDEVMIINNLDNEKYKKIQQHLINTLDKGDYVHIIGRNKNKTNIKVNLHQLYDKKKETNFENCLADVNIPVGEVFTSPVLNGTNGILHVPEVYLNGLKYKDLEFRIKDGQIESYTCKNFENEDENLNFIKENILYNYETLPMGEFAIGTNTTAYTFARKYNIQDKLDILIAEKTGPHFAFGDTCYSHQEDLKVYNPDGKEIIAKDNEVSSLRNVDISKAYFGCHTDITIPFDEIDVIKVVTKNNKEIEIIKDGFFVLKGTKELNKALK